MRPIDADKLKVKVAMRVRGRHGKQLSINDVMVMIDECLLVNAEPVRHGKWIPISDSWECSECGEENAYAYDSLRLILSDRYCPNCGAKMDGE